MRVVLDTNVILSGIFWNGPPFEILELWKKGRICLLVSREIIEEYQRAGQELAQKKPNINLTQILNLIVSSSEVYFPEPLFAPVCRDSKDDKFIACALTGNADFIVSGDKDLLVVAEYSSIKIIRPRDFLSLMLKKFF